MFARPLRRMRARQLLRGPRRLKSTQPSKDAPSPSAFKSSTTDSATASNPRIARIQSRLPKFLHKYTVPLLNAPVTHITSFLLLHELTAIIPLFGLAGFFHYSHWLPPYISEGQWVSIGVEKFGRWFRRRGWLGKDVVMSEHGEIVGLREGGKVGKRELWWGRGEGGVRLVVELATAYAITKALLPLRLILSVWATPWFARVAVIPSLNAFKGIFRRKP